MYPQAPYQQQVPPPWVGQPQQYANPYPQGPYQPYPQQPGQWNGYRPPVKKGMPAWAIALIVILAVFMLGGIVAGASSGGSASAGTRPTVGQQQSSGGTEITAQQGGNDCPQGSLEGCYDEGQMDKFLGQAIWFVQGFSDASYKNMPHPKAYLLVGEGESAQSPCGTLDDMTYAYCPGDDRVYIGQQQLWQFYSGIGDAAAVVGLAHEYGHHLQQVAGVADDRTPQGQVRHENQADCVAGAFVGWAKRKGYLEASDAQDIAKLVQAIASSENDPNRDHGDLQERAQSLSTGLEQGLQGCDSFYPGTPISA